MKSILTIKQSNSFTAYPRLSSQDNKVIEHYRLNNFHGNNDIVLKITLSGER